MNIFSGRYPIYIISNNLILYFIIYSNNMTQEAGQLKLLIGPDAVEKIDSDEFCQIMEKTRSYDEFEKYFREVFWIIL